jgi:predicted Zn-dependent protease with MMP-like domain
MVERERFQELVAEAIENLPQEFQQRLENITVVVQDWPNQAQLASVGVRRRHNLLGLYEGMPLIKRSVWQSTTLPDKITIFRKPIEMRCRSDEEIIGRVQGTVRHEIAHHFGLSDKRLREIERQRGS